MLTHFDRLIKYYDRGFNIKLEKCSKKNCACKIFRKMYRFSSSGVYIRNLGNKYSDIVRNVSIELDKKGQIRIIQNVSIYKNKVKTTKTPKYLTETKNLKTYFERELKSREIEKKKNIYRKKLKNFTSLYK